MKCQNNNGKIALVTGASSGLGYAMSKELKSHGYRVISISRTKAEDCSEEDFFQCDLGDVQSRNEVILRVKENFSKIDILINNAGIGSYATNYELDISELRRLMEINYFAVVDLNKELIELIKSAKGKIVNISSVAGLMPVACMGAYCSSKSALFMHSESLRMELKGSGVQVLTVCPGRINTGFSNRAIKVREVPNTPTNDNDGATTLAKKVYKGLRNNKERLIFPAWYRFVITFSRMFPKFYRKGNQKVWQLD